MTHNFCDVSIFNKTTFQYNAYPSHVLTVIPESVGYTHPIPQVYPTLSILMYILPPEVYLPSPPSGILYSAQVYPTSSGIPNPLLPQVYRTPRVYSSSSGVPYPLPLRHTLPSPPQEYYTHPRYTIPFQKGHGTSDQEWTWDQRLPSRNFVDVW